MKKKLLLTLMLMVALTAAMRAQDTNQTLAPSFTEIWGDSYWENNLAEDYRVFMSSFYTYVTIENNDDAEVTIYYRRSNGYNTSDWEEYVPGSTIYSRGLGETTVEAYAVAADKLPSETVSTTVFYYDAYLYASCVVDGIHYYLPYVDGVLGILGTEAFVCSSEESKQHSQPYSGDMVIPSEFECAGETFTVIGVRSEAFASTSSVDCDVTSVELPSTITSVLEYAFDGCPNLNRITLHALTPPEAYMLFNDNYTEPDGSTPYDEIKLFVPNESFEDYRAHEEWGKFVHITPFVGVGPGDVNGDGAISIKDVTDLVDQLLSGGDSPAWMDANGDGNVSIKDITDLIDMLLSGN